MTCVPIAQVDQSPERPDKQGIGCWKRKCPNCLGSQWFLGVQFIIEVQSIVNNLRAAITYPFQETLIWLSTSRVSNEQLKDSVDNLAKKLKPDKRLAMPDLSTSFHNSCVNSKLDKICGKQGKLNNLLECSSIPKNSNLLQGDPGKW